MAPRYDEIDLPTLVNKLNEGGWSIRRNCEKEDFPVTQAMLCGETLKISSSAINVEAPSPYVTSTSDLPTGRVMIYDGGMKINGEKEARGSIVELRNQELMLKEEARWQAEQDQREKRHAEFRDTFVRSLKKRYVGKTIADITLGSNAVTFHFQDGSTLEIDDRNGDLDNPSIDLNGESLPY